MQNNILANKKRLLALTDTNRHLNNRDEKLALELFRQHMDDLEVVHLDGIKEDASLFPKEMEKILEG